VTDLTRRRSLEAGNALTLLGMREPGPRCFAGILARPWLAVVALALVAVAVAACGGDDDDNGPGERTPIPAPTFSVESTMGQLAAGGKITIGVKFDQPGFGFKDSITGEVDGFDVALGKEIGRALGLEGDQVEFVQAVTARRIELLETDEVDLIIATMTITDERRQQVDFSSPYYVAGQSILVRDETDDIDGVDDLDGRTVCTVQGSTSATNLQRAAPDSDPVLLETYADCVAQLKERNVDAVTTDDSILLQFVARDETLKLVGDTFSEEPYGIGVKKGKEDLVGFLDTVLADMMADGRWDAIYAEYVGSVPGFPDADEARGRLPER
jgi:glutamate transport system substrate-binding protein